MQEYIRRNPIPLEGNWDAVSGEEFLRKLLTEGVDATSYKGGVRDPLFSCVGTIGVDPRAIGQRVMDIRSALAKEFIQVCPHFLGGDGTAVYSIWAAGWLIGRSTHLFG